MEEAWAWLEKSIAIKETYQNLGLKARTYATMGRKADAIATGEKAIQVGKAADAKLDASALEKLLADKYGILIYLKVEKQFFPASLNPRYHQILARMGLE